MKHSLSLLLLALIIALSSCVAATINVAPISPLPLPVNMPTHIDSHHLDSQRAVRVTCASGRPVILENYPDSLLVGCAGSAPTPTATPTATGVITMPTFTSQPDASAGIDGYNLQFSADTANGTNAALTVRADGSLRAFALIKFDVSSLAGMTVDAATLYLYNGSTATGNRDFAVNAVLAANSGWVEGLTWNYANPSTVRWAGDSGSDGGTDAGCSVSGTDWNATNMGTFSYTANNPADTEHAVSLNVAQVQDWVDGNNYGLILRRIDLAAATFSFRSSDYATAGFRPKLVIDYTEATADGPVARTLEIGGQFGVITLPTGGAGVVIIN